jgi:hypothetical protein
MACNNYIDNGNLRIEQTSSTSVLITDYYNYGTNVIPLSIVLQHVTFNGHVWIYSDVYTTPAPLNTGTGYQVPVTGLVVGETYDLGMRDSDGRWTNFSILNFTMIDCTTITIKGEKGMAGTVELTVNGWLWHITSPITLDIGYGGSIGIPATYIDTGGIDQMAIIQMGANNVMQAALDENYSGGNAEKWVNLTDCDIVSSNYPTPDGNTVQLHYPKSVTSSTLYIDSIPPKAKIIMDNVDTTFNTPYMFTGLTKDTYEIVLKLSGYNDFKFTATNGNNYIKFLTESSNSIILVGATIATILGLSYLLKKK